MDTIIETLAGRALEYEHLPRGDLLELARRGADAPEDLLYWAGCIREARFGKSVRLCCIVAGKLGGCSEDCKWCAQSAAAKATPAAVSHTETQGRLRATPDESLSGFSDPSVMKAESSPRRAAPEEIHAAIRRAIDSRASRVGIVNSGRGASEADIAAIEDALAALPNERAGHVQICASLGELSEARARRLKAAGVRRYHHNLETSERMFPQLVSTHTYGDKLATLDAAAAAGLEVCCGALFGLGETWEDRVDVALAIRDRTTADTAPLNFLHARPGTPLEHQPPMRPMDILRTIALFRFAMPAADIKVAGGREANLRDLQSHVFRAGASSLMTGHYLTTTGRGGEDDLRMIADLGLEVVDELPTAPAGP